MSDKGEFILLRGVLEENIHCRFFTTYTEGQDHTKLIDGTVAYSILGYADTIAEAQKKLYGKVYNVG